MRFEGPGPLRQGRRPRRPGDRQRSSATMASKAHLHRSDDGRVRGPLRARRTATCRRPTRRSSARMPPATERGFRTGGFAVPKDLTRADYRASWAKMVALLGPDAQGGRADRRRHRRLRHRDRARARNLRAGGLHARPKRWPRRPSCRRGWWARTRKTGSIKVGKTADLALVEGDPSTHIGDLRQTRLVMLDGKLLDADALRRAAGFSGRPKASTLP